MLKFLALALLLGAIPPALAAPAPPLCRIQASSTPHLLGRQLTASVRSGCPPGGLAYLRLASSLGGSQPDTPPGRYTLSPGQTFHYVVLPWWRLEWQAQSGRWWPVPEGAQ